MDAKAGIGIPEPGDRVLWMRFSAFGDVLESVADACNFKKHFPETHLTFLSSPEHSELIMGQPCFDDVLAGDKSYAKWWQTVRNIRAGRYKWLITDHTGGKSFLMALFSRAKHRVGSCDWSLFKHIYHINMELWFRHCGINIKDRSQPSILASDESRNAALNLLACLPERRLFAVIGSKRIKKMWTERGWIDFLRPLANEGWGIVLNGHGPREEELGRKIESALASGNVMNLIGALDFKKMSAVALGCTLAIGNDTGPMHLAALGGVPTMGLFSYPPSDAARDLLNIPWFRALCAKDYVDEKTGLPPIKSLPAEPVAKAFGAFAAEFLREPGTRQ